jgi:hypothetical protein
MGNIWREIRVASGVATERLQCYQIQGLLNINELAGRQEPWLFDVTLYVTLFPTAN